MIDAPQIAISGRGFVNAGVSIRTLISCGSRIAVLEEVEESIPVLNENIAL